VNRRLWSEIFPVPAWVTRWPLPLCGRSCTPPYRPGAPPGRADLGQFLAAPAHAIVACDFLVVETVLLKRLYVLVFIEHGTRRPHLAAVTAHPTGAWAAPTARPYFRAAQPCGPGSPARTVALDQLQVWSGLRAKSAVVVASLAILTDLVCGAHASLAAISVSGLLRVSSQSTYWPFLSVLRV
jgi:hypothetical protein